MGGIGALNSLLHVHPELGKKLTSEQIDRIARRVNSDEFLKFASKGTPFGQKLFPAEEIVSFESREYLDWHHLHESAVIKVSLNKSHPAQWREICVSSVLSADRLAEEILYSFDADLSHLWVLKDSLGRTIACSQRGHGKYPDDDVPSLEDTRSVTWPLLLWYDFGDDWKFTIRYRETLLSVHDFSVIQSKGDGIIEDCGEIWVLNQILGQQEAGSILGS